MKFPTKSISDILLKPPIYTRNHNKKLSLFNNFSTQEPQHLQNPPSFDLFSNEILSSPSFQISPESDNRTSHNLYSSNTPKTTTGITVFDYTTPKNGSFCSGLLDFVRRKNPIFRISNFGRTAPRIIERRSFSLLASGPSTPDAIHVVSTVNSPFESSPPIDAGSSIRKPISLWPGMYNSPVTNALWEARSSIFESVSGENATPQSELIAKPTSSSRTSILYRFSEDYILREQYRNPWNEIRMGKLLEDLDALAGTISFKHCSCEYSSTNSLLLVTASVDKMVLRKPIVVDSDLTIAGAVTWVGRSSMEIQLEVNQSSEVALTANFTFVARDAKTGKSAIIKPDLSRNRNGEIAVDRSRRKEQIEEKEKRRTKERN